MKNDFINKQFKNILLQQDLYRLSYALPSPSENDPSYEPLQASEPVASGPALRTESTISEVLFVTTFPPRECGIATYSEDLIKVLQNKFSESFSIKVCALESGPDHHEYASEPAYIMNTTDAVSYHATAVKINQNPRIKLVVIQHEFGLFDNYEGFVHFLDHLEKPVLTVFHTVLPHPDPAFRNKVREIAELSQALVVMTHNSKEILEEDYQIESRKVSVIPHGTHLVPHMDKKELKQKYQLEGKQVISTFGLLSSGKSIETTLDALPEIIKSQPDIMFLIIGKTHPSVVKAEGEKYRDMLLEKVEALSIQNHVRFVNYYLPLHELLEYLQLTDIYLFTSVDPNQAVSGTFSYAISCGCPIISTPIPHAKEVLKNDLGLIVNFKDSKQLASAVIELMEDEARRKQISLNGLHTMASTAWENSAIAHAMLFNDVTDESIILHYTLPSIKLDHIKRMTTEFGMIQFSIINKPDIDSGYTIDDNARALITFCQHFEYSHDPKDLKYMYIYYNFINYCLQTEGYFLNYVDEDKQFTKQNDSANLADANGRAIWALGYLISMADKIPQDLTDNAEATLYKVLNNLNSMHSTRAMAFAIKGLYYANTQMKSARISDLITALANRLLQMFKHEASEEWAWYESYMTYANSILPEAMLCAYADSGNPVYRDTAKKSFDFLLSHIFVNDRIRVISNKSWMQKGEQPSHFGEQPIDVAYSILALSRFYDIFRQEEYLLKMETAFTWFLGNNHLQQTIYNPCTGGCYDGLEETHVNLNQGAESAVSYMMARLEMEKYKKQLTRFLEGSKADTVYN